MIGIQWWFKKDIFNFLIKKKASQGFVPAISLSRGFQAHRSLVHFIPFAYPFLLTWKTIYVSYFSVLLLFPLSPKIPAPKNSPHIVEKDFLKPQGWCKYRPAFSLTHTKYWIWVKFKKIGFQMWWKECPFHQNKTTPNTKASSWVGLISKEEEVCALSHSF